MLTVYLYNSILAKKSIVILFFLFEAIYISFLYSNAKEFYVLVFGLAPLLTLALFEFRFLFYSLPILLFVNIHYYRFSSAEFISILVIISFLICYRNITVKDIIFPNALSIILYGFILLISTIKSVDPLLTIVFSLHYLIFVGLIVVFFNAANKIHQITNVINIFLTIVAFNSIHVIFLALLSGARVFGFAGIMFVDYVGIGIVISSILSLFAKNGTDRIIYLSLIFLFTIALVLTQTRTSWISTFVIMVLINVFISMKEKVFKLKQGTVKRFMTRVSVLLLFGLLIAVIFNPETFSRIGDLNDKSNELISKSGEVKNSLISRLLIWDTAYNAFMANPILGIGAYSFPFSSMYYYTIPDQFYEMYVETLTPHQTYVAVAVETGLIGIAFFVIMVIAISSYTIKTVIAYANHDHRSTFLCLGGTIMYIIISMFTTDAWLWGHGIVLFGIFLGLFYSTERISQ